MINTKLLRSCYHHINFLSTINSKLLFLFLFFCLFSLSLQFTAFRNKLDWTDQSSRCSRAEVSICKAVFDSQSLPQQQPP